MRVPDAGLFISAWGGGLTLASALLSWYGSGISVFEPTHESWFVPWLILIGGTISLLSRYGALVSSFGLWAYQSGPPLSVCLCPFITSGGSRLPTPIQSSFGPGFWIAWMGILIALQGGSRNFRVSGLKLPDLVDWIVPAVGTLMVMIWLLDYYLGGMKPWTLLELTQSLPVVVMGMVMVCSGLIRTGTWARMFEPRLNARARSGKHY